MVPHGVCLTKNWNASKTRSVPSQMYLFTRWSMSGPNAAASRVRIAELTPSAATTRSCVARSRATSGACVR